MEREERIQVTDIRIEKEKEMEIDLTDVRKNSFWTQRAW